MLAKLMSRRAFSRADIRKGLDPHKVNRRAFIKKELTENPEFFKAFPSMQAVFNAREETGELADNLKYKEDSTVAFDRPEGSYFETLLHHHNHVMPPSQKEEAIRENERNFVESYLSPKGPSKWLSKEQIEKVHAAIDAKMQEMEDSGLTRDEFLYDK